MSGFHPTKDEVSGEILDVNIVSGSITGANGAILDGVDSNIKATVLDKTNSNPVATAIVDDNGDQITSFGGGTQYTEGDIDASITGTALLFEGAANALVAATGDASNGLDVDVTRSALPTGASTLAEQQSQTTHLSNIADDVDLLQSAVFAEDDVHTNTDNGVHVLGVRRDADTSPVGATGEYHSLIFDDAGNLKANVKISALPSGAATSAKQDTEIGHLATIAGDTTDIEAAVELIDDTVQVLGTDTYTETSSKGITIGAVRRDADTTLVNTTNEFGPLQMDANGRLKVEVFSGETLPVSLATVPSHAVTNAGTFAVQVDGNALTALQLIDDTVFVDDAAFTPGTSKVSAIGLQADESSTDSVDEGDIGAPRMTLDRKQISTIQPHTAGGLSVFNATSSDGATALTSTAQAIKASAGQVYGWYIYNPNSSAQFVQFYNTASGSVTVGTTNPLFMLTIPATSAANVEFTNGITFSNAGFSCAATSTAGGNGAPTTALDAVIFYK